MDQAEAVVKDYTDRIGSNLPAEVMVSLVVPTFNERDNIEPLIQNVFTLSKTNNMPLELIIVDDDSPDGTGDHALSFKNKFPLKIVKRRWRTGLSSAVLEGFEVAEGDIIGIMDADMSHDYRIIPQMAKAIREEGFDIAVGSRYIKGGGMDKGWPFRRRALSFMGTILARRIIPIHDPLSGFILFRREILNDVKLNTYGFKIGLEILIRTGNTNIKEIPYIFINRKKGKSKINIRATLGYIIQLCDLALHKYKKNL